MRNTALVPCCVYSVPTYSLTRFLTFFRNSNAGTFPMKRLQARWPIAFVGHVCCDVKRAAMKGGGPPIIHPRCFLLLLLFGGGGGGNPFSNLQTFGAKKIRALFALASCPIGGGGGGQQSRPFGRAKKALGPPFSSSSPLSCCAASSILYVCVRPVWFHLLPPPLDKVALPCYLGRRRFFAHPSSTTRTYVRAARV